jgi:mycothiol system anti-sigma-R factor
VECKKFQEQITAAVDDALTEQERQELDAHLRQCPACTSSYAAEAATRSLLKTRCKRMRAPGHVLHTITMQLDAEPLEERSRFKELLGSIYFRPAIAFAFACMAIVFLVNNDSIKRTNVMKQAFSNYRAVLRGEIKPQMLSSNVEQVQRFFSGKTEFPAFVPTMNGCTLVGGVVNEVSGKTLAHVVFNHHGSELVYVYEACWETVQQGELFHLSKEIQDQVRSGEPYVATDAQGCTVVLWQKNKTLCSAVAKLDQETLLACLGVEK